MKKNHYHLISRALLAAMVWTCGTGLFAQTATVTEKTTVTKGAITQYTPSSKTVIIQSETGKEPVQYIITEKTTVVDAAGKPVLAEAIKPGLPAEIHYYQMEDRWVASRIVLQSPAAVAPVETEKSTTTITTERPLTEDEQEAIEEEREERAERREERRKEIEDADDD